MKKQMLIFISIALVLPSVMGFLMGIGYYRIMNINIFPYAQMLYPAAGVMLAVLLTRKGDPLVPRRFFAGYLIVTVMILICSVGSIFASNKDWWTIYPMIFSVGSIVTLFLLLSEKSDKREAYGLKGRRWKSTVFTILLFVMLYFVRTVISFIIGGEAHLIPQILRHRITWMTIGMLPISFLMSFTTFLGEEYGWRYYLQPVLQKKFGMVRGMLLLGLIWGMWHWPLDFFFYTTPADGFINVVTHVLSCTTLSFFWGWAYLKTDNIWAPVLMHMVNNELSGIATGSFLTETARAQTSAGEKTAVMLVLNLLLFGGVVFTKYYRDYTRRLPTMDERAG